MPQLSWAQLVIISRRLTRSSMVFGIMNDIPTASPEEGEAKVITSLMAGLCCWS